MILLEHLLKELKCFDSMVVFLSPKYINEERREVTKVKKKSVMSDFQPD